MINKVKKNKKGYLEVDISTPACPNAVMKILPGDFEDLNRAGINCIWADRRNDGLYARAWYKGRKVYIHRLLVPTKKNVGHVNGNKLDNLRRNLRKVNETQSSRNAKIQKNNTSGYRGVSRCGNRWRARIDVNGHRHHLGMFDTAGEAAIARRRAARRYYGEYANYKEFAA